jgi:HK97 family phage major capsid protein
MPTEIEMLEKIQSSMDQNSKEYKEMKAAIDEAKKTEAKFAADVETINKELKAKDATIGDISEKIKELQAKSGRFKGNVEEVKSLRLQIVEAIEEHKAAIIASENGPLIKPIEFKAAGVITTSGNFTGTNAPYRNYLDWQPGMEPTGQFRFRSLVRTIQSDLDNVSFPRANTPIGQGSFGVQVLETDTKAQIDRSYTMIDVICKVVAGFAIVGRRSLVNIKFLQSWLPTSMMEQLEDTEDARFANALVAAATGSASTTGMTSTALNTGIIKIVAAIKNLIAAKFNPGTIACDPTVWANLFTFVETNAGFSLPNVVTCDPAGNVRILGRIIQPVNWLTGGRYLIADWSKVAIVESEGLTMRQADQHASIFTANQLAFLLERVEELAIFRPDAVVTGLIP